MGYAIYHTSKGKGSGGGLGNHIDRTKGKEYSFQNADETKINQNIHFSIPGGIEKMPLEKAIKKKIDENYNGKRKIRPDAVKYITHILTGSHEDMKRIFKDEKLKNDWIKANAKFVKEEFGDKNIVRFSLHMDEKTPHIHCISVPITEDGRLSAKELIGNRNTLKLRQDRYAEIMKPFGLERGITSARKRETSQQYNARLNAKNEFKGDFEPIKTLGVVRKDQTIQKLKEQLKTAENIIKVQAVKNDLLQKQNKSNAEQKQINYLKANNLEQKNSKHLSMLKDALNYEDKLKSLRERNGITPKEKKPLTKLEQKKLDRKNGKKDRGFSR